MLLKVFHGELNWPHAIDLQPHCTPHSLLSLRSMTAEITSVSPGIGPGPPPIGLSDVRTGPSMLTQLQVGARYSPVNGFALEGRETRQRRGTGIAVGLMDCFRLG